MRRAFIILLVLLAIPVTLFADNAYFSVTSGLITPVTSFSSTNDGSNFTERHPEVRLSPAYTGDVSIGYEYNKYFGLGATLRADYIPTGNAYRLIVPLYLDIRANPSWGIISFPITFSVGGHMDIEDGNFKFGPSAAISLAAEILCSENLSFFFRTFVELHMGFGNDISDMRYDLFTAPVTAGITYRF